MALDDSGWVKLHRSLMESAVWSRGPVCVFVAVALLLKANHRERFWRGRLVRRGQLVIGQDKFAGELGLSRGALRRALAHLEIDGFCRCEAATFCTVVSICNYDAYQGCCDEERPEVDTTGGTTGDTTASQRRASDEPRLKNDKNEKKVCVPRGRVREGGCQQPVGKSAVGGAAEGYECGGAAVGGAAEGYECGGAACGVEPSEEEVRDWGETRGRFIDAARFIGYWRAAGWARNGVRVRDWRGLAATWREDRDPAAGRWQEQWAAARREVLEAVEAARAAGGRLAAGVVTGIVEGVKERLGADYRPGDRHPYCGAWYGAKAALRECGMGRK